MPLHRRIVCSYPPFDFKYFFVYPASGYYGIDSCVAHFCVITFFGRLLRAYLYAVVNCSSINRSKINQSR